MPKDDWAVFRLNDNERKSAESFRDKHGKHNGRMTYSFTPTGIGDDTVITCSCGKSANITDHESW